MKIKIEGVSIVWLALFSALAYEFHPAWLIAVAAIVAGWFVNPRWSKTDGWRFLHD